MFGSKFCKINKLLQFAKLILFKHTHFKQSLSPSALLASTHPIASISSVVRNSQSEAEPLQTAATASLQSEETQVAQTETKEETVVKEEAVVAMDDESKKMEEEEEEVVAVEEEKVVVEIPPLLTVASSDSVSATEAEADAVKAAAIEEPAVTNAAISAIE
jgi:hypothetical protein